MNHRITGNVSVSVLAGHLKATTQEPHPLIGQQVSMGDDLYFSITPAVAKQWLTVLTAISKEGTE